MDELHSLCENDVHDVIKLSLFIIIHFMDTNKHLKNCLTRFINDGLMEE
jgi:hypothetical protein